MKARELMTPDPFTVTASDCVFRAAELMRNVGVGSLPVVRGPEDSTLVGIITDRDIVTRCVAARHYASCDVGTHMTGGITALQTVGPNAPVREIAQRMEKARVRRVPVVDDKGMLLGIVTQADLATKLGASHAKIIEEILERISEPVK